MPVLSSANVLVVAGKGGVGKTTVTAVLAHAAAAAGMRALVVELDDKPVLRELVGDACVTVSAPDALEEYLREHGFGRFARRLAASGVIDVVSTAAPGIDDIVVLGRIKQLERSGEWDVIVVDGPAAGHAVTMLMTAAGFRDAARGGPIRSQADEVSELLHDPTCCSVILVTVPEATPVNETIETAFALEDRVGVSLGPIVVNGVDLVDRDALADAVAGAGSRGRRTSRSADSAALIEAGEFRLARLAGQADAIARLGAELPLRQLHVSVAPVGSLDAAAIGALAAGVVARDP